MTDQLASGDGAGRLVGASARPADPSRYRLFVLLAGLVLAGRWCSPAAQQTATLVISELRIDAITHSSARVGWVLSSRARSYVEYGRTTEYGYRTEELDASDERSRVWILTGMAPDTVYHFRVRAIDERGGVSYSDDRTVRTTAAVEHPVEPELPREYVDVAMPAQEGRVLPVRQDCSDFMTQVRRADWGDTVVIPASTTCTGTYTFPAKPEDARTPHRWIVIRTSTPDAQLPPEGVRVNPSWASRLARLALDQTAVPHRVAANAHHYRFVGIEFTVSDETRSYEGLLSFDARSHHVIVDRCYLHGYDHPGATRRGLSLDGSHVALVSSYLTINNWRGHGFALVVDSGPGPGKITNNFIQGPGITLFWTDNVPTPERDDYEVSRNLIAGDDRYRQGSATSDGRRYIHRQPLELKRGRRFLIEGNTFENWWGDEIAGGEIMLFTPRGGHGFDGNQFEISDVTITNNHLRDVPGGFNVTALNLPDAGGNRQTRVTKRFKIANNLLERIDGYRVCCGETGGVRGIVLRINGGVEDVIFEHNTVYQQRGSGPRLFSPTGEAMEGLVYRNNVVWLNNANNIGGFLYQGTFRSGPIPSSARAVLDAWAVRVPDPFYVFTHNVFPGAEPGITARFRDQFPDGNFWPGDGPHGERAIQFVNPEAGDYQLKASSPYKGAGTDGLDVGANMNALRTATGRVQHVRVSGVGPDRATVSYLAPDAFACTVEVGPVADFGGATRRRDAGGEKHGRRVEFLHLSSNTRYHYRVLCASEQPIGTFTTTP